MLPLKAWVFHLHQCFRSVPGSPLGTDCTRRRTRLPHTLPRSLLAGPRQGTAARLWVLRKDLTLSREHRDSLNFTAYKYTVQRCLDLKGA